MGTAEIMMLTGISMFTAALLALVFMLGRWNGERRAAREHVEHLAQSRTYLAEQRRALAEQRAALDEQRAHLDLRGRRTERLPDTGRAHVDNDPTREIDVSTYGRPHQWMPYPDGPNKRGHYGRKER